MLVTLLTEDCVLCILAECDSVTIEVLRHVPKLIPAVLLEKYERDGDAVDVVDVCKYAVL